MECHFKEDGRHFYALVKDTDQASYGRAKAARDYSHHTEAEKNGELSNIQMKVWCSFFAETLRLIWH